MSRYLSNIMHTFKKSNTLNYLININKETPKPLGRWNINQDSYLKADYANMDSCGDVLCGKPDHFKKYTKTNNNNS